MPALCATGAGEAVGEDAALEVAAELALDVAGNRAGVIAFTASQRKPGLEVRLNRAIQPSLHAEALQSPSPTSASSGPAALRSADVKRVPNSGTPK